MTLSTINIHAWKSDALKAEASLGSLGACILNLTAGDIDLNLFLPATQYTTVIKAAALLDAQSPLQPNVKPFSTYPEDRNELLALCSRVSGDVDGALEAAYRLADLVKAILEDETALLKTEAA